MDEIAAAQANGWEAVPFSLGPDLAAVALLSGTEIHFKVLEPFRHRVIARRRTQAFLRPLFDRMGFLTTRTPAGDQASRRFIERLGFRETWSDDTYNYFMLTALPFER